MRKLWTIACMTLIGMWATDGHAVIIDQFNGNAQFLAVPNLVPPANADSDVLVQSGADILGDEREVELVRVAGAFSAEVKINDPTIPPGRLQLSSGFDVETELTVVWDNFTGVDLTDGGSSDGFVIVASADATIDLEFTVSTNTGDATGTVTLFNDTSFQTYLLAFEDFLPGVADFTSVDSIELFASAPPNIDLRIDLVKTAKIPEPSALAIWGMLMGIGTACGWRRRRRVARV